MEKEKESDRFVIRFTRCSSPFVNAGFQSIATDITKHLDAKCNAYLDLTGSRLARTKSKITNILFDASCNEQYDQF